MFIRFFFLLVLFTWTQAIQSQTSREQIENFEHQFDQYTRDLIRQDALSDLAYSTVWEEWVAKASSEGAARFLLYRMAGYHFREDTNLVLFKNDLRGKKKWLKDSIDLAKLDSNETKLLASNFYLAELISKEHINFKDLDNRFTDKLKKTLKAYELKPNQSVVEIGAGNGFMMSMMLLCTDSMDLFVNEINPTSLALSKRRYEETKSYYPNATVHFIQGRDKSINIEKQVDKIIAKNAFHHFEFKEEMLEDISKALKPNGYFYLDETLSNSKRKKHKTGCKKALTLNEIRKIMKKAGFQLHKETYFSRRVILKYSKSSK